MRDGYCPKCGSADVYRKKWQGYRTMSVGNFGMISADPYDYLCGQCGYVEIYIDNEEKLAEMRQHWDPVDPKQKRKNDEG